MRKKLKLQQQIKKSYFYIKKKSKNFKKGLFVKKYNPFLRKHHYFFETKIR